MGRSNQNKREASPRGRAKPNTRAPRPNWEADNTAGPSKRHVAPSNAEIRPLTQRQREYDAAMRGNIIVFGTGPAGTGKTWLAAARAAEAYRDGLIEKIIITRPNVEAADDGMGFLPGELEEKFEPYFRPVRDILEKVLGSGTLEYAMKVGDIEARPIAFLRGATLEKAWVICDEMQNATKKQMQLVLSRAGEDVKFIVNGDEDQCDIPEDQSGLMDAVRRLAHIDGVATVSFDTDDIVRSGICREIIKAYSNKKREPLYNSDEANDVADDAGLRAYLKVA